MYLFHGTSKAAMLLIGLLIAEACNPTQDCPWDALNNNCFCVNGPNGMMKSICKSCALLQEGKSRCGCFPSIVAAGANQQNVSCSDGICVPLLLTTVSTYVALPPLLDYQLHDFQPSVSGWAQTLTWTYEIKPCLCPSNQLMTQTCAPLDIYKAPLCSVCPPGQFCNGKTTSEKCAVGSYCFDGQSVACDALKAQQCTVESMSQYSVGCLAGQTYSHNLCTPCPMGTYLAASSFHTATACTPCDVGFYQMSTTEGATSSATCVSCVRGTYAATTGQTICETCVRGTYQVSYLY